MVFGENIPDPFLFHSFREDSQLEEQGQVVALVVGIIKYTGPYDTT